MEKVLQYMNLNMLCYTSEKSNQTKWIDTRKLQGGTKNHRTIE